MTKENTRKLENHYLKLISGNFTERDFDIKLNGGGIMNMGEMPPERKQLIISDAKKNLKNLRERHPWLIEETPKSSPDILNKISENRQNRKKKKKA